ncbi:FidL-like protein [Klebsiella oxytoca]|uniref:FidL-like protein n=1 Tax=Klebsiella oxytoca TaxID=571 RepID=UPI00387378E4
MNDNERSYPISRFVTFTYQNNGKKVYTFRRVNVEKSVHDNLSDMTQGKSKRMLPLTQKISFNIGVNKNYIIFSNAVSPLFICIRS